MQLTVEAANDAHYFYLKYTALTQNTIVIISNWLKQTINIIISH